MHTMPNLAVDYYNIKATPQHLSSVRWRSLPFTCCTNYYTSHSVTRVTVLVVIVRCTFVIVSQ